ncbi:MAG: T9SS type A sorting domain-containing protein [Crocinitomix sp.]|nr:T9SS type A sorting domain-containing protein [Crocinitomix sp.]
MKIQNDLRGKIILEEQIVTSHIDMSPISSGIYVLQIRFNRKFYTKKLIIK